MSELKKEIGAQIKSVLPVLMKLNTNTPCGDLIPKN